MAATRRLPAVPGLDPLAMTVTPMSLRTDYQISPSGHRLRGYLRRDEVIDTGWQTTARKAADAFGRELAALATRAAARYTTAA